MIRNALDNGKFASGVLKDLRKTFDTVNHDILLSKPATELSIQPSIMKDLKSKSLNMVWHRAPL